VIPIAAVRGGGGGRGGGHGDAYLAKPVLGRHAVLTSAEDGGKKGSFLLYTEGKSGLLWESSRDPSVAWERAFHFLTALDVSGVKEAMVSFQL